MGSLSFEYLLEVVLALKAALDVEDTDMEEGVWEVVVELLAAVEMLDWASCVLSALGNVLFWNSLELLPF